MSPRRLVAPVLLLLLLATGCNSLGSTDGKNYISQDGTVTTVDAADRGAPITLTGTGLDGKPIDLSTYLGKPVVINVWGSWCAPCVAEGDVLAQVSNSSDVPFLGIDIRDNVDSALAFNRSKAIAYPSINDPGGATLLGFRDYPVQSPPTTFVLDSQGRVAAVVSGEISSPSTLSGLIDDVVASDGGATAGGATGATAGGASDG